jgi:hypothetical protein
MVGGRTKLVDGILTSVRLTSSDSKHDEAMLVRDHDLALTQVPVSPLRLSAVLPTTSVVSGVV